jgi:DNA-binding LacI/PurR family transcriptional regulator
MPRRVTLRDVAAELGVSAKTVSNAYSRPDQLSAKLRAEILAAAARIGYAGPDPLAAGLRTGRIGAIGVAYSNGLSYAFDDSVAVEVLAGITGAAERAESSVLLLPASTAAEHRSRALSGMVVDALIANSLGDEDAALRTAIARHLPLAVIDQPGPRRLAELGAAGSPWVGIDDRAAARALADHLLGLGHRRLAVVCFGLSEQAHRRLVDEDAQREATFAVTRDRLAGVRDAATGAGLDWGEVTVFEGPDSTREEGRAGARAVLARAPRPTALLCLSDRLALGALDVLAEFALRVPEDVSVAGFDDAREAAAAGLTTIRHAHREKGRLAAEATLGMLAGSEVMAAHTLPTELIVRGTTAPPPALS